MPARAARWALTAACLMLVAPGATLPMPAAEGRTRIGIFGGGRQDSVVVGRALGVRYLRMVLAVNGSDRHQLAKIQEGEAAGFRLNVQFNNLAASATSSARSGPVADDAAYESAMGAALDATHPNLVTIQNEEDGLQFWNGTPRDYLHELTDAAGVAHSRGRKISNGGITAAGVKLAYWYHLWSSGQHAAADGFARSSLGPATSRGRVVSADLPTSGDPDRPILAHIPLMRAKLERVETLIAGYRATGADYVNFHWYGNAPDDLRAVATWLSETTGLPAICNEMGQEGNNPEEVNALLEMSESLHLAYIIWFSADGNGPAVGLADPDGALRANGQAFKAFVASHR